MSTQSVGTKPAFLIYDRTMGMTVMEGRGFYYPVDTAIGKDDRMYVISRSKEETTRGIRVTMCDADSGYFGNFGGYGRDGGQFVWPACGTVDSEGRFFISDEKLNRITAYDESGVYLFHWGSYGPKVGELDTPAGLAFDGQDNLFVADTYNNRAQKFTADGRFLLTCGDEGEQRLSLPWGLTTDHQDSVYVADFGNDCIKKFSSQGELLAVFGSPGDGDGEFRRPASVAVDREGYIYVADWGNERVQVLDSQGGFVMQLRGEATLSKWAENFLSINVEEAAARATANLEPEVDYFVADPHEESSHIEKLFWSPVSVKLDSQERLYVTETSRHRVQVYRRSGE